MLLGALTAAALTSGVARFHGTILANNLPMTHLLASLGAQFKWEETGIVSVDMPTNPEEVPNAPTTRFIRDVAVQTRQSRWLTAAPQEQKGPAIYARGGIEPPLDEVMREPIMQTIMYRDGWAPEEVWNLIAAIQQAPCHNPMPHSKFRK